VGSCYGEGELFGLGTISAGCPFFVKGIATDRLSIFDFSFSIKKSSIFLLTFLFHIYPFYILVNSAL